MSGMSSLNHYFQGIIHGNEPDDITGSSSSVLSAVEQRTYDSTRSSFEMKQEVNYEIDNFESVVKHLSKKDLNDIKDVANQALSVLSMYANTYDDEIPSWANEGIENAQKVISYVEQEQKHRKSSSLKPLLCVFRMAKKVGANVPSTIASATKDYLEFKAAAMKSKEHVRKTPSFEEILSKRLADKVVKKIEVALDDGKSTITVGNKEIDIEDAFASIENASETDISNLGKRIWLLKYDGVVQEMKDKKTELDNFQSSLSPNEALDFHWSALKVAKRSHLFEYAPIEDRDAVIFFLPKKQKTESPLFVQKNIANFEEAKSLKKMVKLANLMGIDFTRIAKKVMGHLLTQAKEGKMDSFQKTLKEKFAAEMLERTGDALSAGHTSLGKKEAPIDAEVVVDYLMKMDLSGNERLETLRANTLTSVFNTKYPNWIDEMNEVKQEFYDNNTIPDETAQLTRNRAKQLIKSPLLKHTEHFPLVMFCLGDLSPTPIHVVSALKDLPQESTFGTISEPPNFAYHTFLEEMKGGLHSTLSPELDDEVTLQSLSMMESEFSETFENDEQLDQLNAEFAELHALFSSSQAPQEDDPGLEGFDDFVGEDSARVSVLSESMPQLPLGEINETDFEQDDVIAICEELLENMDDLIEQDPEAASRIFALVQEMLV